MCPSLQDELKQNRPFASLEQEVHLSVLRTAAVLERRIAQLLKPHGLTLTQYNVLRILRGAGDEGLCRNEVGERLLREVPDVTRLLDRMKALKLIRRQRSSEDRRLVRTHITPKGLTMLDEIDGRVRALHCSELSRLDEARLRDLLCALEAVREGAAAPPKA
jgi:DNA-binding MarR family transcriptional regulator